MNVAKISADGQIILPQEIQRLLGLKSGDSILFLQNKNGEIVVRNASSQVIRKAQLAFADAAEAMNIRHEADVQSLINEIRYGITEKHAYTD